MALGDPRIRNRRGEGSRLRGDIVAAAVEVLEATGSADAVTLRAVARQVGISAPSIYGHFPDRDAVIQAVITDGFTLLTAELESAIAASTDPVERLFLGCAAYLHFGDEHPHVYQVMFAADPTIGPERDPAAGEAGNRALEVLVEGIRDAVAQGHSASTDPFVDAVATWVALHGLTTLTANNAGFPWPDLTSLLHELVRRLARLS